MRNIKPVSMIVAILMASQLFSGCAKNEVSVDTSGKVGLPYQWMGDDIKDSSDIASWNGKNLNLTYWYGQGTGGVLVKKNSAGDVLTPEITRVTGVTSDDENSIDNGGQSFDVKLSMLLASQDFPDVAINVGNMTKLVDADAIYDLTDLLPKYAPSIMKKMPKSVFENPNITGGKSGKIYGVPCNLSQGDIRETDSSIDIKKWSVFEPLRDSKGYVWVRDDIVKKLYPNAKTQDEIEKMYVEKGSFSEQDIFDVPINSYDDFVKFLYDIKKLDMKDGNKKVYPTFAFSGTDNWSLMQSLWQWLDGRGGDVNHMFTYWDKKEQKVQLGINQDFFKKSMKVWNKLVRDDVASIESFLDPADVFKEKLNNGLYAVSYGYLQPDVNVLAKANKPYRYRKVYLNIGMQTDRFAAIKSPNFSVNQVAIFKSKVAKEDVPQILRWLDYMESDIGEKVMSWGPRSAGLFKEENGNRTFIDKELEQYMAYGKQNEKGIYYNLFNGTSGGTPIGRFLQLPYRWAGASKFHPAYTYETSREIGNANKYFASGYVKEMVSVKSIPPAIFDFAKSVPEAKAAWGARTGIESALTKTLAATSDEELEKKFAELQFVMGKYGWDEKMLDAVNAKYNEINAAYMSNLK